jgi:hypothetical protein
MARGREMEWESQAHLEDHFYGRLHGRALGCRTMQEYDASAQETVGIGIEFRYYYRPLQVWRIGFFHRDSSRLVCASLARRIISHFQTDEAYVAGLAHSTYTDE